MDYITSMNWDKYIIFIRIFIVSNYKYYENTHRKKIYSYKNILFSEDLSVKTKCYFIKIYYFHLYLVPMALLKAHYWLVDIYYTNTCCTVRY